MEYINVLVWNTMQNPGVQVELLHVYLVFLVVVLIVVDKVLSLTLAEEVECSILIQYGEDFIEK